MVKALKPGVVADWNAKNGHIISEGCIIAAVNGEGSVRPTQGKNSKGENLGAPKSHDFALVIAIADPRNRVASETRQRNAALRFVEGVMGN